jgi:mRNA-degrading endonuclease RelE of RelBE toxin-antitoxin system
LSRFAWEPSARADLRAIDQAQALNILHALNRFAKTGVGDVRKLTGDKKGRFRFRIGNWRIKDAYRG